MKSDFNAVRITPSARRFPKTEIHFWADLYELLALISHDEYYLSDFDEFVSESEFTNEAVPRSDDPIPDVFDIDAKLDEGLGNHRMCGDVKKMIVSRAKRFKPYYPFRYNEADPDFYLTPKSEPFSNKETLYCYLLFCSYHTWIFDEKDNAIRRELTDSFEFLASAVLRAYLSKECKTILFGASPFARDEFVNCKNIDEKVRRLAEILGLAYIGRSPVPGKYKDGGMDVVAMKKIKTDSLPSNNIVIVGQAKCSIDWHKKTLEPYGAIQRFSNHLQWQIPPLPCMIVPYDYRDTRNKWFEELEMKEILYFDRLRILNYAGPEADVIQKFALKKFKTFYRNIIALTRYKQDYI